MFDPKEVMDLNELYGAAFSKRYAEYIEMAKAGQLKMWKKVPATEVWHQILTALQSTSHPWLTWKDTINMRALNNNTGTIHMSNLCTEIVEYTAPDEIAVCNLASIALPRFVINGKFDHQRLFEVTYTATKNLNKIIDRNYYPIPEARKSNMRHRPIGLGVQGLADVFILLRLPFESDLAKMLNKNIFETSLEEAFRL